MNENNFENNDECDFLDMVELIEYQRMIINEWKNLCDDQKSLIDIYKNMVDKYIPNIPKH